MTDMLTIDQIKERFPKGIRIWGCANGVFLVSGMGQQTPRASADLSSLVRPEEVAEVPMPGGAAKIEEWNPWKVWREKTHAWESEVNSVLFDIPKPLFGPAVAHS